MSYQDQAEKMGFVILDREEVFARRCITCYGHAQEDDEQTKRLRARVKGFPGKYVIFNPACDAEGFVLVGDEKEAIAQITVQYETEMAA